MTFICNKNVLEGICVSLAHITCGEEKRWNRLRIC